MLAFVASLQAEVSAVQHPLLQGRLLDRVQFEDSWSSEVLEAVVDVSLQLGM